MDTDAKQRPARQLLREHIEDIDRCFSRTNSIEIKAKLLQAKSIALQALTTLEKHEEA